MCSHVVLPNFCLTPPYSQRQTNILVLIVSTLSSLLDLISSSTTDLDLGRPAVNAILTYQASYRLNTYLSGTHSELILVSLKLWNSLSSYRSGDARKIVMDAFAWEAKVNL
jgi:nucleolar pre-ribosomal-associated protein 1